MGTGDKQAERAVGPAQARRPPSNGDTVAAYPDLNRSEAQYTNERYKEERIT